MNADDIWNDLFGGFEDLDRMFGSAFPFREPGMRTYGYSVYQGPDGIRHVREFGSPRETIGIEKAFTDVSEEQDLIRIVAEIPGVEKQDIQLSCTPTAINIKVDAPNKSFSKDLALPCEVDMNSAKATYNNGLLEVTLDKLAPSVKGRTIEIA